MLNMTGRADTAANGTKIRKTWTEILIDALIIGSLAGVALLGDTWPTMAELWIPLKTAAAAFILQVAIERGLKRPEPTQ